jgi:hypothetical protein
MDILKKIIGVLCMLIAPYAAFLLTTNGIAKIAAADAANKSFYPSWQAYLSLACTQRKESILRI